MNHHLKELPSSERPQERLIKLGAQALSDTELLALIIRSGTSQKNVLSLAGEVIRDAGSLAGLLRWDSSDFTKIGGIGKVKALQLSVLVEISKRIAQGIRHKDLILDDPKKVWAHLHSESRIESVEKVWVLCLDRKNKLIRQEIITSGTANSSLIHAREVFRPAIRHGCSAIILAHNHPSGDPTPSAADIKVTGRISEAAKCLEIDFLDHIILGEKENCPHAVGYFSFADSGLV